MVMVTVLLCFGSRVNLGIRIMVILGVVSCSSSALYGLCILSLLLLLVCWFVSCVILVVAFYWHVFWLVECESVSAFVVVSIFSRTKMSKWGRVVTPKF